MTVTESERQRIIEAHEAQKKEELRQRMSLLGRSKSRKKQRAVRKNLKAALAAKGKKK
jgi:hypothetical protein